MITGQTGTLLRQIATLVDAETTRDLTDAQLLQRFVERREQSAFAALVQRHGRLVWGVCRHLLGQEQDAEDAFQATFLVLARRAGAVHKTEALASFLHGVAYRVAMKAKQSARKRQARELLTGHRPQAQPPADLAWRELQAALDEEVARLPERYRAPFVLCCLEGRTREEAVRELGCKEGTVSSRVARARRLLQERLAARGVTLSAALCAGVLWKQSAAAAVSAGLVGSTLQAMAGAQGEVSAAAARLAEGVMKGMGLGKWHVGGILVLGLSLLATGAGLWGRHSAAPPAQVRPNDGPVAAVPRKDLHGDPLPSGALARLGTVRQRAANSHLAVTADGKEVVTVGPDMTVRRFDARTGQMHTVRRLAGANLDRNETWLSPRGTYLLMLGTNSQTGRQQFELWDLAREKLFGTLTPPGRDLFERGAAFSADERRVAVPYSSAQDGTHGLLVWDLETFTSWVVWSEKKPDQKGHVTPAVALSPDGARVACCHVDLVLRCHDARSGKVLWQMQEKERPPLVFFSPDGRTVVTDSSDWKNGIAFRDAATGKPLPGKKPSRMEAGHPIGFSPDGRFLAFQTGQEEVVLWEPGKEKVAFRLPRPPHRRDRTHYTPNQVPTNFAFTPDSKAFIRRAGALQRWDLGTGKPAYADTESWGHTEEVTRLLFSPDGRLVASLSKDHTARLWDVRTARTAHTFPKGESDHLTFTSEGRYLLTLPWGVPGVVEGNKVLRATDVVTGREGRGFDLANRQEFWPEANSRYREMRVTEDGKKVLMLTYWHDNESVLTAWDAATRKLLVHKRDRWRADSVLTPDGRSVLMFDPGAEVVRLLDVETGKRRWQLQWDRVLDPERKAWGCDLALSPNGRRLVARLSFRTGWRLEHEGIRVGDMATGRQIQVVPAEGAAAFAFSTDGHLFAVADRVGVRLWETASWKAVGSIQMPDRDTAPPDRPCASSLAFSPDGRALATGHADGTILLWDATLRRGMRGGPLSARTREALWVDLAGADVGRAQAALWKLVDDPRASVSFLQGRLQAVLPPPPGVVQRLLDDLDHDEFKVREAAQEKLRALGETVGPLLREALKAKPALEKRRRIAAVLRAVDTSRPLSGERLRAVRAVAALERIGSVEARQALEALSRGVESARLTQAAREALTRLKKP
jgi:RNA polymerase sigma factor (sigma-70 family)